MLLTDTTRSITGSLKRFVSGTALSRFSGLFREIAMAAAFGTSPSVAAFWMAFRFAYLLRRVFGEGALNMAFIPHFEALRKETPSKAARFFSDLSRGLSCLLLIIIFIGELVLALTLFFGNLSPDNTEVVQLSMLLLPALLFICLYALNLALLQCEGFYFLPSAAPACSNLLWVAAVFLLWHQPTVFALRYLAISVVFAFAIQWLVTVPAVNSFLSKNRMEPISRRDKKKEFISLLRPFCFGLIGVAATQINSALDALFARAADPEGPAYLWYAIRVQQLPLAFFGVGMMGALLPPLSRAIQKDKKEEAAHFLRHSLDQTILFMIPATIALFALGKLGIKFLFGHGAFSDKAIVETSRALWAYSAGLLPMSTVLIFATPFYARKEFKIPMKASLAAVVCNIVLNALFVMGFGWGAISVALATAISALLNVSILISQLRKEMSIFLSISAWKVIFWSGLAWIAASTISQIIDAQCHGHIIDLCVQASIFGFVLLIGRKFLLNSLSKIT